ncbi:phosphonate metabolism transcriptional regulator PhnF [Afifella sp. IM 167]|uniref:phosphonate metabolism transcriptional regulator PhnF n=1 Tax=Afifella sp. IM 167 TaxID=2033586 RepID=UPI001CCDA108|nr:phosphonate metabolism transcriptional regulator PhnF [Afifella sp. IM 167]MBZ8132032.1 phosphonate metabolism transcriptional regulator PhnF [Afifella sp. IM 167]
MTGTRLSPGLSPASSEKRVSRRGGISLWRQIADVLRAEVIGGTWSADMPLPSEAALAQRFGVNRHTLRRALAVLADEGLVRSDQGRGTFVTAERLSYPIGRRTRFSEIVSRQTRAPGGQLVASRIEPAPAWIAEHLSLAGKASLVRLETLSVADGVPISTSVSWFSAERFPALVAAYAETGSITAALARHGVSDYFRRWTKVRARPAEPAEMERLLLPRGASVLAADALNEDGEGVPVHFSETTFAADRIELFIEPEKPAAKR